MILINQSIDVISKVKVEALFRMTDVNNTKKKSLTGKLLLEVKISRTHKLCLLATFLKAIFESNYETYELKIAVLMY